MDGLILYNGNSNGDDFDGESDDFIALYLINGYVEFAFNAGDGVTIVRYAIILLTILKFVN